MSNRPALFLDRDGVINRERGEHTWRLEDFEVLPDVVPALRLAVASGYALVVITNQSGIGLGLHGHAEVAAVHAHLRDVLAHEGVHLDEILYCPHHPSGGKCLCRKPGSLLLERAIVRQDLNPARSVMIGDRDRDIAAADAVGVRGVLVDSNSSLLNAVKRELRTA
ncbi:MAG: HAD family hydrolase [Flavobacteriales bacterium]|nr:HAD family hydrolase [Flavobacteriales bacterium]